MNSVRTTVPAVREIPPWTAKEVRTSRRGCSATYMARKRGNACPDGMERRGNRAIGFLSNQLCKDDLHSLERDKYGEVYFTSFGAKFQLWKAVFSQWRHFWLLAFEME